eukprot:7359122-Pyramimonas_sp.AAC.3
MYATNRPPDHAPLSSELHALAVQAEEERLPDFGAGAPAGERPTFSVTLLFDDCKIVNYSHDWDCQVGTGPSTIPSAGENEHASGLHTLHTYHPATLDDVPSTNAQHQSVTSSITSMSGFAVSAPVGAAPAVHAQSYVPLDTAPNSDAGGHTLPSYKQPCKAPCCFGCY